MLFIIVLKLFLIISIDFQDIILYKVFHRTTILNIDKNMLFSYTLSEVN